MIHAQSGAARERSGDLTLVAAAVRLCVSVSVRAVPYSGHSGERGVFQWVVSERHPQPDALTRCTRPTPSPRLSEIWTNRPHMTWQP